MKIAVLSLADINNYGDAFFPYVFRAELRARLPGAQIDLYTNTPYDCGVYKTKQYSKNCICEYDAVILAGGETIHFWEEESWENLYPESDGRISDIAFDWLTLKRPFKAYFSVGVHPNMCLHSETALMLMRNLDYLAVRGELSKKILEGDIVSNSNKIRLVPDLGWLFNRYLSDREPLISFQEPYMVFEMFYEFDEETIRFAARTLTEFQSETGVRVVLLPIVHTKSKQELSSWNDYYPLSKLMEYSNGTLTLAQDNLDLFTVGSILKRAKFYLGGSMHGAVTCLAHGRPAGNILTWTAPKLQDLHGARMRQDCFINHWGKMPALLRTLNREAEDEESGRYAALYADYMRYRLSVELDFLCEQLVLFLERKSIKKGG